MTQTPHSAGPAQPQPGQPQPASSQGNRFWDDITSTGLRRDRSRQWFAGVCSGIARRVDVDPVLIRAAFIALTLFGGFGIVAYLVAWLFMPDEAGRIMARDAVDRNSGGEAGGAIVLSVIAVLVIAAIVIGDNGFLIGWGVIPLAVIGWLFWRHEQGKKSGPAWSGSTSPGSSQATSTYAAGSPAAAPSTSAAIPPYVAAAQDAPVREAPHGSAHAAPRTGSHGGAHGGPHDSMYGASHGGWQPPPAPPVPPRAHVPLAPPPPPRPRRRTAGFAGFALVLGVAVVGYGAGLLLDDPVGFPGSRELLGGVIGLGLASLATLVIGLSGRRSLMSAGLVTVLGLGVAGTGIVETSWDGDRGVRTWTPVATTTTQHFDHSAGRTTIDLRPLFASLSPNPDQTPNVGPSTQPSPAPSTPSPGATASPVPPGQPTAPVTPTPPTPPSVAPQDLDIEQGAGEMTIIVPQGANAQIRAKVGFGEVRVVGNLPEGVSDRDNGGQDGPNETLTLNLGSGAPTVIVRADLTVGQITIQEG